jgi:hypothetical protein
MQCTTIPSFLSLSLSLCGFICLFSLYGFLRFLAWVVFFFFVFCGLYQGFLVGLFFFLTLWVILGLLVWVVLFLSFWVILGLLASGAVDSLI